MFHDVMALRHLFFHKYSAFFLGHFLILKGGGICLVAGKESAVCGLYTPSCSVCFRYFKYSSLPQINYIQPDRKSISSSLIIEPFAEPVLGSRQCTRTYTETVDPACRPGIPHQWYWHGTLRQGSVRFNLREEASLSPLFPSRCTYSLHPPHHHHIFF